MITHETETSIYYIFILFLLCFSLFKFFRQGKRSNRNASQTNSENKTDVDPVSGLCLDADKSLRELTEFAYTRYSSFFTPHEYDFYNALLKVIPTKYTIFSKVRVADIFRVQPSTSIGASAYDAALRKIWATHFDFIILLKETMTIVLAVELQDKSHHTQKQIERDEFKRKLAQNCSLPLLQVWTPFAQYSTPSNPIYQHDEAITLILTTLQTIDSEESGA